MLGQVVTSMVCYLYLIDIGKEKFGRRFFVFSFRFGSRQLGHDSSATPATEQPPEQQTKIFGRPAENDFKIGTSRDKMKYKAIIHIYNLLIFMGDVKFL